MTSAPANPYLRTKVMTASPAQLRLMLYDGAIKFCRQGVDAIGRRDWEAMYESLVRAQKIVLELNTSLRHDQSPEVCDKLAALYNYIYRRLVDANMERDTSPIDEAIGLLEYERETWLMVIKRLEQGEGEIPPVDDAAPEPASNPVGRIGPVAPRPAAAQAPAEAGPTPGSFSVEG